MSVIKLLNGLDLSGKTSIALEIQSRDINRYIVHRKFVSNINVLDDMQHKNVFVFDPYKFTPLLINLIQQDIFNLENGLGLSSSKVLIQDSLWPVKYATRLLMDDVCDYHKEAQSIIDVMKKYPSMDSYYFFVEYEERRRRFLNELEKGARITPFDKMIMNETHFSKIEEHYKGILLSLFPNTKIVDTTILTINEVADYLTAEFECDNVQRNVSII
ncbi:MAG: hypothetical protein HDR21_12730 [Lachnospiraceae bacterium]|nr:hypothetical protein [Lachnospiraceae bacterium]